MLEVKRKYGDERRSQIFPDEEDFEIEDLIAEEDVVITITHTGYIKRMAASLSIEARKEEEKVLKP